MNINDLQRRVEWVWLETLKIHRGSPETRIASSLSPIEVFVALYYGGILKYNADVVYGSRFVGGNGPKRLHFFWHTIANKFLTTLFSIEKCFHLFESYI